ncbi:Hypp5289 [Branchiostoma lanceolatum]|uniref:Hypp5289 protein n=1 Tax=Branchiostoma lanceolatum TaxID=7740 RepID=A0A8K0AE44_BRALA|nr:Hypp5289 [Branchiostoma lanceolatum]
MTAAESATGFGQGTFSSTVLTNRGDNMTVLSDLPFHGRQSEGPPVSPSKGYRPMQRSTLTLEKNPFKSDHKTTVKHFHSGDKVLPPVSRPAKMPSMHTSQIDLKVTKDTYHHTHHRNAFLIPPTVPATVEHEPSNINRHNQRGGFDMRRVLVNPSQSLDYWTTYARIHDKVGHLRGPGAPRVTTAPERHNILSGASLGPGRRESFERTSGNRVLHHIRANNSMVLLG